MVNKDVENEDKTLIDGAIYLGRRRLSPIIM
jgi:hypothetical protein